MAVVIDLQKRREAVQFQRALAEVKAKAVKRIAHSKQTKAAVRAQAVRLSAASSL